MAGCFLREDPTSCWLYKDPSTSCSYYDASNFTHVPESTLASINSSSSCAWLEGIITKNYTAQDVWRDLLTVAIYNRDSTNCYGDQYMDYLDLNSTEDMNYSRLRGWLIPSGLASRAEFCTTTACQESGATGNPDIAGIGMLVAYAFELFFIIVFYISQITGRDITGDEAHNNVIHRCICPPATAHEKCTGGVDKCGCSAVVIHSECCDAFHERKQSAMGSWRHKRAMKETTASFLDAAIFFALSISIGAIATASPRGFTRYEKRVLGFAFLLTCSPLYIVLAYSSKTLRRRGLRRSLISLAVILFSCAILLVLTVPLEDSKSWRWDVICLESDYHHPKITSDTFPLYIIFLALFLEVSRALAWVSRLTCKRYLPNRWPLVETPPEKPWGHRNRRCNWQRVFGFLKRYIYNWTSEKKSVWAVATCGLLVTVFAGVSLALERAGMQRLAGGNYKESEMTYGQYLAMLIWVPVLVEYGYVAVFGVTRALEGRLPTYYAVARPAEGQHWLPVPSGAGGPDQVGEHGSGGELEPEQTDNARGSLTPHSELTSASQVLLGSARDRRRTDPD